MIRLKPVLLLFLTALFLSCTKEEQPLLLTEDYTSWEKLTQKILNYPIPGHMDHYRMIYINKTGTGMTDNVYPEGTIIVKEVYPGMEYHEGEKPVDLTIMVKDSDHPDAQGGWVWLKKSPEDKSEQIIKVDFCLNCHANANEEHPYNDGNKNNEFRDYVFYTYHKKE